MSEVLKVVTSILAIIATVITILLVNIPSYRDWIETRRIKKQLLLLDLHHKQLQVLLLEHDVKETGLIVPTIPPRTKNK